MPLVAMQVGTIFIIVVLVALPLGALVFAMGAGNALQKIGKGDFALEQDFPQSSSQGAIHAVSAEVREEEIRQMVQARSDRAMDVAGPSLGDDRALREEVRQLVVARNERRQRQGKEPLDVEQEVDRQLRDLENLGQ